MSPVEVEGTSQQVMINPADRDSLLSAGICWGFVHWDIVFPPLDFRCWGFVHWDIAFPLLKFGPCSLIGSLLFLTPSGRKRERRADCGDISCKSCPTQVWHRDIRTWSPSPRGSPPGGWGEGVTCRHVITH